MTIFGSVKLISDYHFASHVCLAVLVRTAVLVRLGRVDCGLEQALDRCLEEQNYPPSGHPSPPSPPFPPPPWDWLHPFRQYSLAHFHPKPKISSLSTEQCKASGILDSAAIIVRYRSCGSVPMVIVRHRQSSSLWLSSPWLSSPRLSSLWFHP